MPPVRQILRFCLLALLVCAARAQVIRFESGGLEFQTLTRNGITIMFAFMPVEVQNFAIIQVAVSNGSSGVCEIHPRDFYFETLNGGIVRAVPASRVIQQLIERASGNDVVKLVTAYEMGLYGMRRIRSTSGYEKRRQAALALVSSKKLKAAAAASAIAFVTTKLRPGDTTDGAVFYPAYGHDPGPVTLKVRVKGTIFEFEPASPSFED